MVNKLIEDARIKKNECVEIQDFETAAMWRTVEKFLYRVESGEENIISFVDFLKSKFTYGIYSEAYELYKYLDVKDQRKQKLEKLQLKK